MNKRDFITAAVAFTMGLPSLASASKPLLILDGDVSGRTVVNLGDHDLAALPHTTFETTTQWTTGLHRFSGPFLADLLHHYGAGPGDLRLTAINNYSMTVSRTLVTSKAPIIANRIYGQSFSRRRKGPFWVIFPYDLAVGYRSEQIFAASVWQLGQITVLGS
jgi:hypothetical protein